MALNPVYNIRADAHHIIGGHFEEEFIRNFVFHPPNKFLGAMTGKQFVAHQVDAEYLALPMMVQQTFPETGANVERVVEILRGNENVGVHEIELIRYRESLMPNRSAYFWNVPPRRPVSS